MEPEHNEDSVLAQENHLCDAIHAALEALPEPFTAMLEVRTDQDGEGGVMVSLDGVVSLRQLTLIAAILKAHVE